MKKSLSMIITGEFLTNRLQHMLDSGMYKEVYETLSPQFDENIIYHFFLGFGVFKGTTEFGGELDYSPQDQRKSFLVDDLFYSMSTCLSTYRINWQDFLKPHLRTEKNEDFLERYEKFNEQYSIFEKVYKLSKKDFITRFEEMILRHGFHYMELPIPSDISSKKTRSGVILKGGTFVECSYMEHNQLYNDLYDLNLGIVPTRDWTDDRKSIHISSNSVNGYIAMDIIHCDEDSNISEGMLETLIKMSPNLHFYGTERKSVMGACLDYHSMMYGHGGKYGNLDFIQRYMSDKIKTPEIHAHKPDNIEGLCIRTSPKYSMAGILDSVFKIEDDSVEKIKSKFEKHKDLIKGNELHIFYQKYIDGINGVAHINGDELTYQCSNVRGDVVNGKEDNINLPKDAYEKLKRVSQYLGSIFKRTAQIEFVYTNNEELYIVQIRLLDLNKSVWTSRLEGKVLYNGKSFYKSMDIKVNRDDVLIAKSDLPSEELVGKKGLIVLNAVEFSHLLALSYSLRIPSIMVETDLSLDEFKNSLPNELILDTTTNIGKIKV